MNKILSASKLLIALTFVISANLVSGAALESPAADELDHYIIGAGGGELLVTDSQLNYTQGQPVTGETANQDFDLCAGYWCDVAVRVYLPMVVKL